MPVGMTTFDGSASGVPTMAESLPTTGRVRVLHPSDTASTAPAMSSTMAMADRCARCSVLTELGVGDGPPTSSRCGAPAISGRRSMERLRVVVRCRSVECTEIDRRFVVVGEVEDRADVGDRSCGFGVRQCSERTIHRVVG